MARNKNPEQTVQSILDTASRFFIEKGYEKTSIQDILNELNLSKGAIYHHFKSKDEILQEIIARTDAATYTFLQDFMNATAGTTARERLETLLKTQADTTLKSADNRFLKLQFQNPLFFYKGLQRNMQNDAQSIADLIKMGNDDGSFTAEEPEMVAEILLMLFNVWTNPVVFGRDYEATKKRFQYLQKTLKNLGVDVFSDELIAMYLDIYNHSGMLDNNDC